MAVARTVGIALPILNIGGVGRGADVLLSVDLVDCVLLIDPFLLLLLVPSGDTHDSDVVGVAFMTDGSIGGLCTCLDKLEVALL